jgi:hypothetical protein
MARDAIAAFLDTNAGAFGITVTVKLPAELERDVASIVELRSTIDRTEREYADKTRQLARRLVKQEGMTIREAGHLLGLSYQRVGQLVASA